MDAANKKTSMGRQKIKMAKIQVKNHLQVTFSKRRSGLIKKASELCTLCGVEIAILVFSPAGKVFPFGHPTVDSVIDRFITTTGNPQPPPPSDNSSSGLSLVEAHRKANIRELNLRLTQLLNELEIEKKRSNAYKRQYCCNDNNYWWEKKPISEMGFHELQQLRDSMEELKKVVIQQANEKLNNSSSVFAFNIGNEGNLYQDNGYDQNRPNNYYCREEDLIRFGYV